MKIVQINSTYGMGSTGKICKDISEMLTEIGIENYSLYTIGNSNAQNAIKCSSQGYTMLQTLKSKLLGNYGFNSKRSTKRIIQELEKIKPDIVHLHNIHSHDCNLEMLFDYFKRTKQKLIWTFHDCWAFTGYCPHFDMAKCNKWKNECNNCSLYKNFSFLVDKSKDLFDKKCELFIGLDIMIVTPSDWLAKLVKESFLKNYPVKVINNGIDLDIFKPTKNDFRNIYNIPSDKRIILGVAFDWGERKGLDVFLKLAERLNYDKYQIVLVGTNETIDKDLPETILSIHRTKNQEELATIYSAADVFVNPTREEVLGLVNIEALACGTPGVVFNTGGTPECFNSRCGIVVENDDIDALEREIIRVCEEHPFLHTDCIERAGKFSKLLKCKEYIDLYERVNAE